MFDELPRPLLFAHRGASSHAPENTLAAFELALRTGADVLEMDVHATRDGRIVVIHDPTLERTTDGRGPVAAMTYAQLAGLDAGFHFRRASDYPWRGKGLRLPLLEEVLAAFPEAAYNIEVKTRAAAAGAVQITKRLRSSQAVLTAADDAVMLELERQAPAVALGLSYSQAKAVWYGAHFGEVPDAYRGRALQVPRWRGWRPVSTGRLIRRASAAGIEVHVWVVNAPRVALRLLRRGALGIFSDDPGNLAGLFRDFRDGRIA